MKLKKIVSLMSCALLATSMLTGCGNGSSTETGSANVQTEKQT